TGGGIGFSASGTKTAGGRNSFGDSTVIAKNTDGYGNATNTGAIKSGGNSTVVAKNETFSQTAKNTPDNQKSAENIKTERITSDDIRTAVLAGTTSGNNIQGATGNADSAAGNSYSADSESSASEASMVVEETPAGLRLSVRELRFKADSADILSDEISRLDQIAEVLKLAPNSHFLIEGHSASVGNPRGELEISEKRAKAIAEQLSKRGIASDRFICRGYGAERPIASNSTAKGKALNRRVEITILE
nr:OmpA family protein [Treponema sp.]